jgi:hypothetical protein
MQNSRFTVALAFGAASIAWAGCSSDDTTPPPSHPPSDASTTDIGVDAGPDPAPDAEDDVGAPDSGGADHAEDDVPDVNDLPRFSFFYTSLDGMRRLSGSENGFGGDLRFGMPTGLEGADKICQTIASDAGFGAKTWRAFLSATRGPGGSVVNAIDRIGNGPWYDRKGRLIAPDIAGLLEERPAGDPEAVNDLPDETGEATSRLGHTSAITASTTMGKLFFPEAKNTCNDWTSKTLEAVFIMTGHPTLATGAANWVQSHPERSCIPGVRLGDTGNGDGSSIGSGGGWGGFYCFALTP